MSQLSWLHPSVKAEQTEGMGRGLFARVDIPKGEILVIFSGRILEGADVRLEYPEELWESCFQVGRTKFLCPVSDDDKAFYLNHSCDPTLGLKGEVCFVTLRDVAEGEQLSFDYCMTDSENCISDAIIDCQCGSPTCRRQVTHLDWRQPALQQKFQDYFSPYLQDMIDALIRKGDAAQITQ